MLKNLFKKELKKPDIWDRLVSIPKKQIPADSSFIRDCNDINKMSTFQGVIDVMIQEQLKAAIDNSANSQDFNIYLASVCAIEKVRMRFKQLADQTPDSTDNYDPYSIT